MSVLGDMDVAMILGKRRRVLLHNPSRAFKSQTFPEFEFLDPSLLVLRGGKDTSTAKQSGTSATISRGFAVPAAANKFVPVPVVVTEVECAANDDSDSDDDDNAANEDGTPLVSGQKKATPSSSPATTDGKARLKRRKSSKSKPKTVSRSRSRTRSRSRSRSPSSAGADSDSDQQHSDSQDEDDYARSPRRSRTRSSSIVPDLTGLDIMQRDSPMANLEHLRKRFHSHAHLLRVYAFHTRPAPGEDEEHPFRIVRCRTS